MPITLSRGLRIVEELTTTGKRKPHWFRVPVESLIAHVGDVHAHDVAPEQVIAWHAALRDAHSRKSPDKRLSPWTVDSYGRAVKSYFNHLVKAGHLDVSPARRLVLPRLPAKGKKDIGDEEIQRLLAVAEASARDHAIVLVLRDAGCRVGELVSMTTHGVRIREEGGELRGRAIVESDKTHASRFVYLGDEACRALERYIRSRPHDAPDALWLSGRTGQGLTPSGVYLLLKRLGKRAGVQNFNAHAFRHGLARRLVLNGAPPKAVQEILGHADVSTTLNMYVRLEPDDLERFHRQYNSPRTDSAK